MDVLAGSYNFSQLGTSAFSFAGTFKLVVGSAKLNPNGINERDIKKSKVFSAWTKSNDLKFKTTSSYLTKVDMDEGHYFGVTNDINASVELLDTWLSLVTEGGEIGYNTTGTGYDVVINIPKGSITESVDPTVFNKVSECMINFTNELATRAKAEIQKEKTE